MQFRFPTSVSNPILRLRAIANAIKEPSSHPSLPNTVHWLLKLVAALPIPIIRLANKSHFSIVMTSFPGPEKAMEVMEGVRLVDSITASGTVPGTTGE